MMTFSPRFVPRTTSMVISISLLGSLLLAPATWAPAVWAHGDDGNVEFTSSIVASHLDQVSHNDSDGHASLSDSLWVNLALNMAFQRDPEIKKLLKKTHRLGQIGQLSALGLSGMGLASSILSMATLNAGSASHAEGDDHDHDSHATERDNPTASVIGVVGSGLSLTVLLGQMFFRRRYSKKLEARQHVIQNQVETAIAAIDTNDGQQTLAALIGPVATGELVSLLVHTNPTLAPATNTPVKPLTKPVATTDADEETQQATPTDKAPETTTTTDAD